tara:strand:- start:3123 stop:4223 length:1101 start_codon:yes stop_codon:yes gene_type:complete
MQHSLNNIFENDNYIFIINLNNKKSNINFKIDFNEINNSLFIKRIDQEIGWAEKIFLHIYSKKTQLEPDKEKKEQQEQQNQKIENIIYIGSSITNEINKIININNGSKKVYVALTTIPSRATKDILLYNLNYLLNTQTITIDKIFITIPKKYIRFKEVIPESIITILESHDKIEIIHIEEDLGPASKYLGPLIHKYNEIENNLLVIIDDDRIYNKNLIKHFLIAHNSYPDTTFITGHWKTFFEKNYKALNEDYIDIIKKKEKNNTVVEFGDGLGGFFGCCLYVKELQNFINYNKNILKNVPKSYFHDEGIMLGYIKCNEEEVLYIKHKGSHKIFKENPDALCESNMCNRKVLEKEIIEYTNREKIL